MDDLLQDLRYALRRLRKSPAFVAIAVLTLALGIGATLAIFTVVNAVLLRPLPFREPERLMRVFDDLGGAGARNVGMSVPERRPDGSSVLDIRILLQTDDGQKIYVAAYGISYTPPGGTQYARILPVFEAGAGNYAWLNNIIAVGVHQLTPGKVVYRIHRIL